MTGTLFLIGLGIFLDIDWLPRLIKLELNIFLKYFSPPLGCQTTEIVTCNSQKKLNPFKECVLLRNQILVISQP